MSGPQRGLRWKSGSWHVACPLTRHEPAQPVCRTDWCCLRDWGRSDALRGLTAVLLDEEVQMQGVQYASPADTAATRLDPREAHFRILSHHGGLSLFLRYLPAHVERP